MEKNPCKEIKIGKHEIDKCPYSPDGIHVLDKTECRMPYSNGNCSHLGIGHYSTWHTSDCCKYCGKVIK